MSILDDNLGEILRVIERLPYPWSFALADHVEASLEAKQGRRVSADEARRMNSERVRQRIRDCIAETISERPSLDRQTLFRLVQTKTGSARQTINDELCNFSTEMPFQKPDMVISQHST
ncbi:MAG: hypothetical protein IT488_10480 [Gammaproteobacteria bacterium]|nr:hypothetical protein [Gammaproteobacteria bacterium]